MGLPSLAVWQSELWGPLSHTEPPPGAKAAVHVAMMLNEYRAGAFNISNATNKDMVLRLQVAGLPGGSNPPYVGVSEVSWTDTNAGQPVAAALPEAEREEMDAEIDAKLAVATSVDALTILFKSLPESTRQNYIDKFAARKKELA